MMMRKMVDYSSRDSSYISVRQQGDEYSLGIVETLRSLREEIKSYKEDNKMLVEAQERLVRAQEKQVEVNAVMLQSLSEQEEKTNGDYGSRSQSRYRVNKGDTIRGG